MGTREIGAARREHRPAPRREAVTPAHPAHPPNRQEPIRAPVRDPIRGASNACPCGL